MVLEKTLESLLDCKEIHPVHPKGDQSWVFIGRTDVEAKTPTLWPPDVKSWLIGKDPDAGKNWGQEEKGMTEDEMVGWHHWLKTWVWVNSRSWWWTGRPGVLQFMGSQRVGHDWVTELKFNIFLCPIFLSFHTVHGVLKARILKWFASPLCSGPCFVRTFYYDLSVLSGPTRHGS